MSLLLPSSFGSNRQIPAIPCAEAGLWAGVTPKTLTKKIKMDNEFKLELMSYYDERAKEYDKIYIGEGPAIPEPELHKSEFTEISQMVSHFGRGHSRDIGCGTGFWLLSYGSETSGDFFLDKITVGI